MKLSVDEKAGGKKEKVEPKAKKASALHNFNNAILVDREKELKSVRHYGPLALPSVKCYEEILDKWRRLGSWRLYNEKVYSTRNISSKT
jgi:hypothetical protein